MNNIEKIFSSQNFNISEANYTKVGSFWNSIVSVYPYNRIYYITNGEATLKLKNDDIKLEAGYLYFIPAYSIVSGSCNNYMHHYYLHFELSYESNLNLNFYNFSHTVKGTPLELECFKIILDNFTKDTYQSKLKTIGAFHLLVSNFFKDAIMQNNDIVKFQKVIDYIEKNLDKQITLKELAQLCVLMKVIFLIYLLKLSTLHPFNM